MSRRPVVCKICEHNTHHHTLPHCHQCEERAEKQELEDKWSLELLMLDNCETVHDLRNWITDNIKHILKD